MIHKGFAALATLGLLAATPPLTWAQASSGATAWIHIRVEEPSEKSRVSVNLPLSLVQVAIEAAPEKIASGGRIHLGAHHAEHGLSIAEMRKLWRELKATGDADLVSVEKKDEAVSVARRGDQVQVRVNKKGERAETVVVDVPVSLVDALLSAEGDSLDITAAIGELKKVRGDVVRVQDDDKQVRIWIDEKN